MKEEQVSEKINKLQQNQSQKCANYADTNADNGERNYPKVGGEIGQTGSASSRVSRRHGPEGDVRFRDQSHQSGNG